MIMIASPARQSVARVVVIGEPPTFSSTTCLVMFNTIYGIV